MSSSPRNRRERRAADEGRQHQHPERNFDREGLGGILAFPMSQVQDRLGISRSKAYQEIAAGRLIARKCGARTLITIASAEAWLDALPSVAS